MKEICSWTPKFEVNYIEWFDRNESLQNWEKVVTLRINQCAPCGTATGQKVNKQWWCSSACHHHMWMIDWAKALTQHGNSESSVFIFMDELIKAIDFPSPLQKCHCWAVYLWECCCQLPKTSATCNCTWITALVVEQKNTDHTTVGSLWIYLLWNLKFEIREASYMQTYYPFTCNQLCRRDGSHLKLYSNAYLFLFISIPNMINWYPNPA